MEDSIYRLRPGDILILCVLGLLALGIIMVQSASMNATGPLEARLQHLRATRQAALADTTDPEQIKQINHDYLTSAAQAAQNFHERPSHWYWTPSGIRQAGYALAAIIVFFLLGRFDYARLARGTFWRNPAVWLIAAAALSCAAVLFIGTVKNGARRWISLGFMQFQPSELGKWCLVAFLAWWLTRPRLRIDRFFTGLLPTLIPISAIALLIVIQDFGTAALIGLCSVTMLIVGGAKVWHLLIAAAPAIPAAIYFITHKSYRLTRILAFLDPYANPQTDGYHMIQSLMSFSTGGVFGRGLGNGIQKLGYLPEDTTDFIFAVICEEMGLSGAALTIALYLGILYVVFQVVRQRRDAFGRMLAFGIGAMIGLQALINIAVATVSVPTKGLSLPLVSYGGTGVIITGAAMGLLHSITRHRHQPESQTELSTPAPDWNTDSLALAAAH